MSYNRKIYGGLCGNRTHVTAVKGRCLHHLTNRPNCPSFRAVIGATAGTRTPDLQITKLLLYQLSYDSISGLEGSQNAAYPSICPATLAALSVLIRPAVGWCVHQQKPNTTRRSCLMRFPVWLGKLPLAGIEPAPWKLWHWSAASCSDRLSYKGIVPGIPGRWFYLSMVPRTLRSARSSVRLFSQSRASSTCVSAIADSRVGISPF